MDVLARFNGRNGEISILQERGTGVRLYHEAGVNQSFVLAGGAPGLSYVRLMKRVLANAHDILLFGCGGGGLATGLYRNGSQVTVVDYNPISFDIARHYFWMPKQVTCVIEDMVTFLQTRPTTYAAIGVDVGGPCFDYEAMFDEPSCMLLCRRLAGGGRIAINIACEWAEKKNAERIATCLGWAALDVWICDDAAPTGGNTVIVAAAQTIREEELMLTASTLQFHLRRVA
jgi:predicted membrane-bound spermidine synthase